ncbi:MucR family transcriptional regulator [Geodermatophilus sp. SYSU D01186]
MLHPVGPLPSAVYWRRRLLLLLLAVAVLGGGGWLVAATASGGPGGATAAATPTGTTPAEPTDPPALEQVVPSLASVRTPTPPPAVPEDPAPVEPAPVETPAAPTPGGPCSDDMIALEVRSPGSAPVGGRPTFELAVANVSAVPCVRALDKELQEIVLFDGAGTRLWGSNDCFPEVSDDTRTLAPGETVSFPLVWGSRTSEPTCTAERVVLGAGQYVLRGRLDTKVSGDAPFAVA